MAAASPSPTPERDPRVYFAAERTFLAWIRTGLGLMGVGFAVARFGLFLRQLGASAHAGVSQAPAHATGLSVFAGVALVFLGVVVLLASVMQHFTLVHELNTGTWRPGRISRNAVLLAVFLALIGIAMSVYLLVLH